jgi:hypothetical protein
MAELKDWWSEVSPLLDEAMELPLAARESWLTDLERRAPELAAPLPHPVPRASAAPSAIVTTRVFTYGSFPSGSSPTAARSSSSADPNA